MDKNQHWIVGQPWTHARMPDERVQKSIWMTAGTWYYRRGEETAFEGQHDRHTYLRSRNFNKERGGGEVSVVAFDALAPKSSLAWETGRRSGLAGSHVCLTSGQVGKHVREWLNATSPPTVSWTVSLSTYPLGCSDGCTCTAGLAHHKMVWSTTPTHLKPVPQTYPTNRPYWQTSNSIIWNLKLVAVLIILHKKQYKSQRT
jgi:hypothetical protein